MKHKNQQEHEQKDCKFLHFLTSSDSLVVMTSALHAEGREFNPRSEQFFWKNKTNIVLQTKRFSKNSPMRGSNPRLAG